ncbi:hypothetical protein FBZ98_1224 [Rhizobium sp. ERR 922]|uniref:hypothetical protein n=1 Tax=unclassified Rhizobium TaxID=2613769 RepID=UPI0011A97ECE|nr:MULTISPECIES: hypothetical protein [unclassified Rhizobium]TWB43568.1 hypothetical protein FBZ98_1224 [Rhizobium sp. ERR 922]TWB90841.1 hypothetical protein FBZ97_10878 [Rhizobium sp. ERR 942]
MEDFEIDYNKAVDAGRRNLKATKLLSNWCLHAEFARMGGRGMIEATTGLPIGHMGVRCKFSKANSMFTWLLEDAAYGFYLANCKGCDKRVAVGLPNIMEFIGPREQEAERRAIQSQEELERRKQEQSERKKVRAELRNDLSLEEGFVLDLIDELDSDEISHTDPRLEQLANLAPESFGRKVIDYLLPAATCENRPYSVHAAKALFRAKVELNEKLAIAVRLIQNYAESKDVVDFVVLESANLDCDSLATVLRRFVSLANPLPPGMRIGAEEREYDRGPIQALFEARPADVCNNIATFITSGNLAEFEAATEMIIGIGSDELFQKHARSLIGKLMRRKRLLPQERRDSSILYYLRMAASEALERLPEQTDAIIQSFLRDNEDIGKGEAYRTYRSVLQHKYGETAKIGNPQKIAFRRLLWAAVDTPESPTSEAAQFFRHTWDEFEQLAAENLDELIGAAATLSAKYERLEEQSTLEIPDTVLAMMERRNQRSSIDTLQGALISWAALGAKAKGKQGVGDFLDLYRRMPEGQTQMRGNMIVHVSKLLSGIESLSPVLSDWYRALMDESALVRASAAKAWEDVPSALEINFPDLFFEAFAVLLTDRYVIVHQWAVRALRRNFFPNDKRSMLAVPLRNLIHHYSKDGEREQFLVDCIDVFALLCLTKEQIKGNYGAYFSNLLVRLEGDALYSAVRDLNQHLGEAPGFLKVILKAWRDDYVRSISIDDCISAILRAPLEQLRECTEEIIAAFRAITPIEPEDIVEALVLIFSLSRATRFATARDCAQALLAGIPTEDRTQMWRLQLTLVDVAVAIENAVANREDSAELIALWSRTEAELETEIEERARIRNFPPHVLIPD